MRFSDYYRVSAQSHRMDGWTLRPVDPRLVDLALPATAHASTLAEATNRMRAEVARALACPVEDVNLYLIVARNDPTAA